MKEIWKKIKNYDDYEISNLGNVKSLKSNKILKPSKSSSGYLQVTLCKNGKTKNFFIHRLVANEFIDKENYKFEVNHKDENKLNNKADNLEWCDRKYNMNYGNIKNKLSQTKMKKVGKYNKNDDLIKIYNSINEAAFENNAKSTNIVKCCKNIKHYKTCKGYKWKYV